MGAVQGGGGLGKGIDPTSGTQSERSTFNSSGQFTAQTHTSQVDLLVVAGGGAGNLNGGGGGAGGFRSISNNPVAGGTTYTVTVGAGGSCQ